MSLIELHRQNTYVPRCLVCMDKLRGLSYLFQLLRVGFLNGWRRTYTFRFHQIPKILVGGSFILGYGWISYVVFYKVFRFLHMFAGLGPAVIERVMYILFAILFVMLMISNAVVGYTNLFRNAEVTFLLSTPIPPRTVFIAKAIEGIIYTSWAFWILISPMLLAYGGIVNAGWDFYVVSVFALILFVLLAGALGICLAVLIGNYISRQKFRLLVASVLSACLAYGVWVWRSQPVSEEALGTGVIPVLDQLMGETKVVEFGFLPSYWLVTTILHWSEGAVGRALFYCGVILSYVLFLGLVLFALGRNKFISAYYKIAGRGLSEGLMGRLSGEGNNPRLKTSLLDAMISRMCFIKPDVGALLLKDLRMFWRDTAQWSQTAILLGLLWFYVINLGRFGIRADNPFWATVQTYLTFLACILNLATITTRFVYPQLSLEGHSAWIIGLSPMGLEGAIRSKLVASCGATLFMMLSLICVSAYQLKLRWYMILYYVGATILMTVTLNALAMGVAMLYPNFRERNPSKIVNGFGGAVCLILSCVYIFGAFACLLCASGGEGLLVSRRALGYETRLLGGVGFILLAGLFGWLPLKLGYRALRKLEL